MGREESAAQAKAAAKEKEAAAHAKKVARKDKVWEDGARDTSKQDEAAAKAKEKADAKAKAQAEEEKLLGGVKTVKANPGAGKPKVGDKKGTGAGGSKYANLKLS